MIKDTFLSLLIELFLAKIFQLEVNLCSLKDTNYK